MQVRSRIHAGEVLEAIIHKRNFIRPYDPSLFIDPNSSGDIHHVVELGDEVLLVNQRGVCWMSVGNPLAGILDAVGVLRDGDDFEVLAFQLLIDCLPSWQVKAAPSPHAPCDKKHFLPSTAAPPTTLP